MDHRNPALKPVDVICRIDREGAVAPLKIRVTDEDGEYQTYKIETFTELKHTGGTTLSDGVFVSGKLNIFECFITSYGRRRMIRLYYNPNDMFWQMTAQESR